MSIFIGSNAGDTITTELVSAGVTVIGGPKHTTAASDLILAGNGNDVVAAGGGDDLVFLGGGNDTFIWRSGDGNDIIDGGSGADLLQFTGSAAAENIAVSAGILGSAQVTRNVGNVTTNLIGVERIEIAALEGQDRITVNDLANTAVKEVAVNLAGAANPNAGDGQADMVVVNGSQAGDQVNVVANGTAVLISGLAATTTVDHMDAGLDRIVINGNGGDDVVTAGNGLATLVQLTIDGGAGNDTITGGDGADQLIGGDGNDLVTGGRGIDTALLGAGNDTFVWNPGDGNDIVEGNAGTDTLQFNGSNAAEDMVLSASGSHAVLTRNVAAITMDLHGMENVNIRALGGVDNIVIGDLRGTDVAVVHVDLGAFDGTDDASADTVTVALTAADDAYAFTIPVGSATLNGLGAQIVVDNMGVNDRLAIDGGAGNDSVTANGSSADDVINLARDGTSIAVFSASGPIVDVINVEHLLIQGGAGNDTIAGQNGIGTLTQLTIDGGAGNDTLRGGDGNDILLGGDGNDFVDGNIGSDTANLGAGDDVFGWDPGDGSDIVEGGSGNDTLQFNGSNASEDMVLSASGSHAVLTRNVAAITMDLHGVESVNIRALGGVDNIVIGDLRGTDVAVVHVDLGAFDGTDDASADTVTVALTAADDAYAFTIPVGSATLNGLGAQILVDNMGVNDRLAIDGGAGNDSVTANGSSADDVITLARDGTSIAVFSASGPIVDVINVEHLLIQGGAGNDTIAGQNGIGTLTQLTLDGGAGNDTLRGGDGNDILLGGDGNDFVDGNIGSDTADLGAGDDVFGWDPGDGSDIVEGGSGNDTLQFSGSNIGENINLSASGSHALLTRNVAAITMDLHGMENVNIRALGGVDNIVIGDMTGSGVTEIHVDLSAFDGGDDNSADLVSVDFTAGDDVIDFNVQAGPAVITSLGGTQVFVDHQGVGDSFTIDGGAGNDSATASGTSGDDAINVVANGTAIAVFANGGQVINVTNVEQLLVEGGAGNDAITAGNGLATLTQLTLDGGAGNDTLVGGDGADLLLGGDGNDLVFGGRGLDTADLGAGDDTFVWNPGDANDVVEGGAGSDTLQFNGANIGEKIDIVANGSRASLHRDVANITMDLNSVERINVAALGGADIIHIGDMTGSGVKEIHVDLGAIGGGDDNSADVVSVDFTAGDDVIDFDVQAGPAVITALGGTQVFVDHEGVGDRFLIDGGEGNDSATASGSSGDDVISIAADGTGIAVFANGGQGIGVTNVEELRVEGGAGNDAITAGNGIATLTHLTIDGGAGNDTLVGGDGADLLLGGDGNDLVFGGRGLDTADLGAGDDTFVWNPGDANDVVEGGAGTDTMRFNGANINENIAIAANGSRASFHRDVANITMDLNSVERIDFTALGGADVIHIGDMTGSGVSEIHVDLGAIGGGDDNSADVVSVDFTAGDDVIDFNVQAGPAVITALGGTQVFVDHQGVGDSFTIDGGAGNDSATASGTSGDDAINVVANGTAIAVFANGGQVINVTNVEQLLVEGGAGNDAITAGNGLATLTQLTLDGGAGNDTLVGGDGADLLLGGDGNDLVFGGRGLDTADLGAGDDTFVWNPGDANDVVEGGAGSDTLQFNGANIGEEMVLSANGSNALLTRNIANITMDLHGVETVNIVALDGNDNLTIGDLTGTDVKQVNLDLGANGGIPDGKLDNVVINGTEGNDVITLSMRDGALVVGGLAEEVVIKNFDPNDGIHIAGLGGDDVIDASLLGVDGPKITLDGGEGNDLLLGGAGNDILLGAGGDDILLGGGGVDVLDGGPGDNVLIQDLTAPVTDASMPDFGMEEQMAAAQADVALSHADGYLL